MKKQLEIISTNNAPSAIGPYSQAISFKDLVFTSGQIPLNAEGNFLDGDIKMQTNQVCNNLKKVLQAANSSLENVIKTTVFLRDMSDFVDFNEVYAKFFTHKPARSTVGVKELPKNSKVEIECIAFKND